jgi:hypothetical protein
LSKNINQVERTFSIWYWSYSVRLRYLKAKTEVQ